MGLHAAQTLGPILDGLMRNTPGGRAFVETAGRDGVRSATNQRDAPFGDYSAAPADRRPDPAHVIIPGP
jgi:enoyl-CoA hydratase